MTEPEKNPYLECGRIINTHGCRGGLKVEPWADRPEDVCRLGRIFLGQGAQKRQMSVRRASVLGGRFILLELEGVDDMDAADALRGKILYAHRDDLTLEEGQYFISDQVGLPVLDARPGREGLVLGRIADILPGAASPIYAVDTPRGQVLVPGVPAFIKEVVPGSHVAMEPIDGMFDDLAETVDTPGDAAGERDIGAGGKDNTPAGKPRHRRRGKGEPQSHEI